MFIFDLHLPSPSLCSRRTACSCSLRFSVLQLAIPILLFRRGWTIMPGRWWSSRRLSPAPSRRRVSSPRLGFVLPTSSFPQSLHWSGASTTPHGSSFFCPSGLGIYTSASAISFPNPRFFFQFLMCTFWAPWHCWVSSCLGIWRNAHALLKDFFSRQDRFCCLVAIANSFGAYEVARALLKKRLTLYYFVGLVVINNWCAHSWHSH